MSKADLRVDWATHKAAKYACERWHYSRSMPVGKLVKIGAWESDEFIGVVIFAWGMNKSLGAPYGLQMHECCELVRVALRNHQMPVSRILSIALKFLSRQSTGLRLVVSFADPAEGHYGGIYQAANWVYSGTSATNYEWRLDGRRLNKRAYTGQQFGKGRASVATIPHGAVKNLLPGKHRYLMPLDNEMRKQIEPMAKPYPKRPKQATTETIGTAAVQR